MFGGLLPLGFFFAAILGTDPVAKRFGATSFSGLSRGLDWGAAAGAVGAASAACFCIAAISCRMVEGLGLRGGRWGLLASASSVSGSCPYSCGGGCAEAVAWSQSVQDTLGE